MRPSVNWLLVFIPVSLGVEHLHVPAPVVFFCAALAIVPIAALIVRATGQLATALAIVRAPLIALILAHLLLALSVACLIGGLRHHDQVYNARASRAYSTMMLLAAMSMTVPSAFSHYFAPDETIRQEALLNVGIAAALLAIYVLYLVYSLKTHPETFASAGGAEGAAHHHEGKRWSLPRALASLVVASLLAAWMSEILVGAADGTGKALRMFFF